MDYFVLRSVSHRRTRHSAAHPIPVVGLLSSEESAHLRLKVGAEPAAGAPPRLPPGGLPPPPPALLPVLG